MFGALQAVTALLSVATLAVAGALIDGVGIRRLVYVVVGLWSVTALVAWWRLRVAPTASDRATVELGERNKPGG